MAGRKGHGALVKLAAFFTDHPNTFIDGLDLGPVAGSYAWRSRVAELRTKLGMDIENRQRAIDGVVKSEYYFHSPARKSQTRKRGNNQHTHPKTKTVTPAPEPTPVSMELPF